MKPLLIIGCGRSATKYITKVLKIGGVQIGHERLGPEGMASWLPVTKKRYKHPFRGDRYEDFQKVYKVDPIIVHQVRTPIKVISSFQVASSRSWLYISRVEPKIKKDEPLIIRCMKYWLYWNLKAERMAEWTYPVEHLPSLWETFCEKIERPFLIDQKEQCLRSSKEENTRKEYYTLFKWKDLYDTDRNLTEKIKTLGRKYGYKIN